jgi:hypothetical protein
MGGHAHVRHAFLFQKVNLVDQGSLLGGFNRSRFFITSPMEIRESANKWREVGLVILTVEPGFVPSTKRAFLGARV